MICAAWLAWAAEPVAYDRISADSLRANVTWLASDARQGRLTPSPGLEASAKYLADRFRDAGLAPAGESGSFFQTAQFAEKSPAGFFMSLTAGSRTLELKPANVDVDTRSALDFNLAPAGDNVLTGTEEQLPRLRERHPALILLAMAGGRQQDRVRPLAEGNDGAIPTIRVYGHGADFLREHNRDLKVTLRVPAPQRRAIPVRNVAGVLRGSDPVLRDQYVIVSAHYDHLGTRGPGPGNRVFHGANDDASGASSLIEIARAFSGGNPAPRRSILFLAFFGEEENLLGSKYYVEHPLVPLANTVADINLEQLGRTDSSDGVEVGRIAFTGPSYSYLPELMGPAAKLRGISIYRRANDDAYFDRSDNYSFARVGIVAHTVVVAFEFADYHSVADEADKLDYNNLVRVDRGLAAGIEAVANAQTPPKWSNDPGASRYRDAVRH